MYNNYEYFPYNVIGLIVKPNYDVAENKNEVEKEINNF